MQNKKNRITSILSSFFSFKPDLGAAAPFTRTIPELISFWTREREIWDKITPSGIK
jgi:hypothetical protein